MILTRYPARPAAASRMELALTQKSELAGDYGLLYSRLKLSRRATKNHLVSMSKEIHIG